jgi:hypothetical protein
MWRAILKALRGWVFGRGAAAGAAQQAAVRHEDTASHRADRVPALAGRSEGRGTMNAAYDKLIQHLDSQNIGYWSRSEDLSICTDFRGEVGTYRIFARVDADDCLFQVFGYSPVRVPAGARPAIAETVMRVNLGLKVGKFEMDYDAGDVRFQAAQILPGDDLEDETIQRLMGTTLAMLNTYLPAILSVIYGNELPADAVRQAEPGRFGVNESDGNEGDGGERRADE